jgi:hypothetical protein
MPNNNLADISAFELLQSDQHGKTGMSQMSVFGAYDRDVITNAKEFADNDKVVATAGSLDAIKRLVDKYFFEEKELRASGNAYKIYNPNKPEYGSKAGKEITDFIVKKVNGRFRLVET